MWTGTTSVSTKGHEGRVDSLRVDPKGVLYSGCSAGIINKWKYSGGKLVLDQKVINMAEIDKFSPGILLWNHITKFSYGLNVGLLIVNYL